MQNVYILRRADLANTSANYAFAGARGRVVWPIECGHSLGFAGAWNFAWRLGFTPRPVTIDDLAGSNREGEGATVLIAPECDGDADTARAISEWAGEGTGRYVVAAGCPRGLLPGNVDMSAPFADPVAPLAFAGVLQGRILVAPPRWPVYRFTPDTGSVSCHGHVCRVRGVSEAPALAVMEQIDDAPAAAACGNVIFLNASPFTALQAWLQGQESVQRWLNWRDRLFWIDELVVALYRTIERLGIPWHDMRRGTPWPSSGTTVCIRHDLDSSRDTSYLDEDENRGILATHAILRDRNTAYWVDRLKRARHQQTSFHYNTVAVSLWSRLDHRVLRRMPRFRRVTRRLPIAKSSRAELSRGGLARQLAWAKRHGIPVETICRHFGFVLYPEIIDELDHAAACYPELICDSTYFRGQIHRWGANGVDGMRGTITVETGTPFSFWYPYRLAHAGDSGRLLRIWELTTVMEPDIAVVEHLLNHRTPELPGRVISLCFHPAHAQQAKFHSHGSFPLYLECLDIIREKNIHVITEFSLASQAPRF